MLGTFLPVALFVLLHLILVTPLWPSDLSPLKPFKDLNLGPQSRAITILFLTLVFGGLWYGLNRPIIRFYEGYPWQASPVGKRRTNHYIAQFRAIEARLRGMRTLLRSLSSSDNYSSQKLQYEWEDLGLKIGGKIAKDENRVYETIKGKWEQLTLIFNAEFPKEENLILPTRLGNVFRSFEDYSYRQYRMEAITLWPRLAAVLPKDYAAAIDSAKASFDFMLNLSALLSVLVLEMLIVRLPFVSPPESLSELGLWLAYVAVFAAIAHALYNGAIGQAKVWGELFKGAFDLYRWDLLKQLGYTRRPPNMREERTLWENIYQRILYGADSPTVLPAEYSATEPLASGQPDWISLETARGVSISSTDGATADRKATITVLIRNSDPRGRTVSNIVVTDTLPEGFDYEWGSENLEGDGEVEIIGGNPYKFRIIGDLEPGEIKVLSYRAISRVEEQGVVDKTSGGG